MQSRRRPFNVLSDYLFWFCDWKWVERVYNAWETNKTNHAIEMSNAGFLLYWEKKKNVLVSLTVKDKQGQPSMKNILYYKGRDE